MEIITITFIQQISRLRTGNRLWHFQCLNILLNLQWLIPAEMKLQKQARPHLPTMQNVDTSLKKSNKSGIEIGNKSRTTLPDRVTNNTVIKHQRCFHLCDPCWFSYPNDDLRGMSAFSTHAVSLQNWLISIIPLLSQFVIKSEIQKGRRVELSPGLDTSNLQT